MQLISRRQALALAAAALVAIASAVRAADAQVASGNVTAQDAWMRATPPGATVAAGYLTLVGGARPARLVGARSERAARVEIHATLEQDGMLSMRPVAGVDVPAHGRVALAPMGTHLMLIGLDAPLLAGQRVRLTLSFADGSSLPVEATVLAAGAMPEGGGHH
jgi:periplasmic copper chaperone A